MNGEHDSAGESLQLGSRSHRASEVVRSYLRTYEKRQESGSVFPNAEASAMVALAYAESAIATQTLASRRRLLESIEQITGSAVFQDREGHAIDVVGLAWATGYGYLPIDAPPLDVIERAFDSMSDRHAKGLFGVAWRTMFLAAAHPLVNAQRRGKLTIELVRRSTYLHQRILAFLDESLEPLAFHETARLAYHAGWLAREHVPNAVELRDTAAQLFAHALSASPFADHQDPDRRREASTVHVAHLLLGAAANDKCQFKEMLADYMFNERLDEGRWLLRATADDAKRYELSPWVLLAVLQLSDEILGAVTMA